MGDEPGGELSSPGSTVAALLQDVSAQPATRRSSNAPTTASSVLPQVIAITVTGGTPVHAFASNAPSATPGHADRGDSRQYT